jgi:AraC-like DNA-binding protein
MTTPRLSTKASSGKGGASRPAKRPPTAPPAPLLPPGEPLLQHKYRELIRKPLGKLLDALFAEFTGLHFHIAWTPAAPRQWDARNMPTGCSVCCRLTGSPLLPGCRICGPRQLARALSAHGEGHRFTCRLGVRNCWLPIRVRGETLGLAYLQALDHPTARPPERRRSARVVRHRPPQTDARVMARSEFDRAGRLLRLIVHDVQTASLADLQQADLTQARRTLLSFEKVYGRWRSKLSRVILAFHRTPPRPGLGKHTEQIVHHLLERIDQDYGKPITLQHYARDLRLNATYLSDLFSHAVGVPFKTYLTDLRLEKARGLLGDLAQTAADVAYAVGYASENRFRKAFKKATGLPPSIWRETLQANPLPPAP